MVRVFALSGCFSIAIINCVLPALEWFRSVSNPAKISVKRTVRAQIERGLKRGQVAQVVERSPEKAGVGGSTPSLATIIPKDLNQTGDFPSVRSQSALFGEVRFGSWPVMSVKDLTPNASFLSPLSVRFCPRHG